MKRKLTIHAIPPEPTEAVGRHPLIAAEGPSNGLAQLAGTWTEEEYAEFEAALATMEQIDQELWR